MPNELPKIGQKIVLTVPYWYDPTGLVPKGSTGVVIKAEKMNDDDEPSILVKLDVPMPGLEDNIVSFYPGCGTQQAEDGREYKDTLDWFYSECKLLD